MADSAFYEFIGVNVGDFTPKGESKPINFAHVAFLVTRSDGSKWYKDFKMDSRAVDFFKGCTFGTRFIELSFNEYGKVTGGRKA